MLFSPFEQNDVSGLLAYSLKVCMSLMQNKQFRNEVLRVLVKLYMNLEKPDFINVCQVACLGNSGVSGGDGGVDVLAVQNEGLLLYSDSFRRADGDPVEASRYDVGLG